MSFLYYDNAKPSVKANFQSLRADEYFVKDPETGGYIPLTGGGGDAPELPYYLKPAKIDLGVSDSVFKTVVEDDGVDVINDSNDTATHLGAGALTFGDTSGNVSLEKSDVKILKDLQTFTANNPSNSAKMLIFDAANQRYAATPWRAYLNTDTVMLPNPAFSLSRLASTGLAFRDSTYSVVGKNSVFTDSMVTLGSRNVLGFDVTHTKPRAELTEDGLTLFGANSTTHARLNRTGVQINDGVTVATLSLPNLQTIEKIHSATDAAPSATGKMLVREEDGTYKRAPITSGGTPLPVWCKTSEAEFTSGDRSNRLDYQGMNLYRDASRDRVGVGYDSMTVCRSNDGISTDTTKPFTTIMRNSITLAENNATSTVLNYSRAKTLENLHAATDAVPTASAKMIVKELDGTFKTSDLPSGIATKIYAVDVPAYVPVGEVTPRRIAWYGKSHFPRFDKHPDGTIAIIEPNTEIPKYQLRGGDSIEFRCLNPTTNPQIYFNTWYVCCFKPEPGFTGPIEQVNVEGYIGRQVTGSDTRVSIDIATAVNPNLIFPDCRVAFRITGYDVAPQDPVNPPDTHPGPQPNPTPQAPIWKHREDVFRGTFRLKVVSYTHASNPPAVQVNYSA